MAEDVKKMPVREYAKLRGITPGAVHKAIRKGHLTPGITNYEMYGGTYILYVDKAWIKKNSKGINKNTLV